jgi:hypothetical protein
MENFEGHLCVKHADPWSVAELDEVGVGADQENPQWLVKKLTSGWVKEL